MDGQLRRRETEDQPAASRIHVLEAEHILQERVISVTVAAEDHEMRAIDHADIVVHAATSSHTSPEVSVRDR